MGRKNLQNNMWHLCHFSWIGMDFSSSSLGEERERKEKLRVAGASRVKLKDSRKYLHCCDVSPSWGPLKHFYEVYFAHKCTRRRGHVNINCVRGRSCPGGMRTMEGISEHKSHPNFLKTKWACDFDNLKQLFAKTLRVKKLLPGQGISV